MVELWCARTRWALLLFRAPCMYSARMSANMGGCWKGKREVKLWRARTRQASTSFTHLSCTRTRMPASVCRRRLKGKRTENYGARENDGRFLSFSRTLHILAQRMSASMRGRYLKRRGIIARKNRMGGPLPLCPVYVLARLSLFSLSIPLNACRTGYKSAFSRVAIFTRALAQLARSDLPEENAILIDS